jgi:hypothetical protein
VSVDPTEQAQRNIGGLQIALLVAGLLVGLVVLWFVFVKGGGTETPAASAAPTSSSPAGQASSASPEPSPSPVPDKRGKGPVETFQVFAPRDPFTPLVSSQGSGSSTTSRIVVEGETGAGTTRSGGAGQHSQASGTASSAQSTQVSGHRVKLLDVFARHGSERAQLQVDSTVYTVGEGQTFDRSFKLLSISGKCAAVLYGDDQFTLCEGQEILK